MLYTLNYWIVVLYVIISQNWKKELHALKIFILTSTSLENW